MRSRCFNLRRVASLFLLQIILLTVPLTNTAAQDNPIQFGVVLGGIGIDRIYSVVRAPAGEFYVGGETTSSDLPVSENALDKTSAGGDGFVARFSPAGDLEWLTYLGGSGPDTVYDLALGDGALYAVGATGSTDFPGARPVNGDKDGFAAAISLDGSALYFSTLLGGSDEESAYAVAVENSQAVVTGISYSTDFSTSIYYGAGDVFVTRLNASGEPAFIQLFGGRGVDAGFDVGVQNGDIWAAGQTFSFNFPARGLKGLQDGFVMRLDANGSIKWATLVGGSAQDNVQGLVLDQNDNAYVTGLTTSNDFPAGDQLYGPSDTYLALISPEGSLSQSVRIGGTGEEIGRTLALSGSDRIILCGMTSSTDFPVTSNAAPLQYGGGADMFIASFSAEAIASSGQYFATYFGGGADESCNGLAAASGGTALFAGSTKSGAPAAFTKVGLGGAQDGLIALISVTAPGALPAPTATLPAATSTPEVVKTPTIPLIFTPPPATATPLVTATQEIDIPTQSTTQQLTPLGVSTEAETPIESPAVGNQEEIIETTQSPAPEPVTKSSTGWWVGGIAAIIVLGAGGWLFIKRYKR